MKKIITASLIALLVGLTATAQDKKVAVFDPAGSVDNSIKEIVREEVSAIIVNASGYTVLERQLINKVLEENRFQSGGLVDDSQVSAMGKHMGANSVFVSSITKIGSSSYYISCKMIDVQTARIERQKTAQTFRGSDDLVAVVQKMVKDMLSVRAVADRSSQPATKSVDKDRSAPKPAVAANNRLYNWGVSISKKPLPFPYNVFQDNTKSNRDKRREFSAAYSTLSKNERREAQSITKTSILKKDEVRSIMRTNPGALKLYNKSLKQANTSVFFYITGVVAGGVGLGMMFSDMKAL